MPSPLRKNLNLSCFTKIKSPPSAGSSLHEHHTLPLCNSSTQSILIKNFNSLYDFTFDGATNSKSFARTTTTDSDGLSSSESHTDADSNADNAPRTPDFATVCASQRFFFSSPGRSNSIIDSSSSMSSVASTSSSQPDPREPDSLVGGSIAIPTYSPNPFMDFRRSMQEMVEANELIDVRTNWDYLHQLLMCYLSLNPKSTHKFIVGAFADLLVSLMTSSAEGGCRDLK